MTRTLTLAVTAGMLAVGVLSDGAQSASARGDQESASSGQQPAPVVAPAVVAKNWKVPRLAVMPLGDSITHGAGSSNGSGYRAELWNRLVPHTDNLDFVGTQRNGKLPDPDHEGHWGWKIGGLSDNIGKWLSAAKPNVVLLHIGTNDMHDNYQVDTAPHRLGELIDKITKAAPDMTVLVSSLVPSSDAGTQRRIEQFNSVVPQLVADRRSKGFHVGYVDMGAVTTRDLSDDLHPKDSGYVKMADAFYGGLERAAADGWVRQHVDIKSKPLLGDYRVDINGDGKADYLVLQDNGVVNAWINNGGTGHG
ncbi:SGNH/GDSL hydrolase family protein, partial [Streptomyces sp. NPDC020379]|uniref:SGNH/GDSL hydrolase family protein n=1 Tax=Streptomyces sp. NPDC020379 TaxID=3365071 RepID=UPI0037922617